MVYFDNEAEELLGSIEGKGTLINQLIKDHFSSTDEDYIRRKIEEKNHELEFLQKKLDKLIEIRLASQNRDIPKFPQRSKEEVEAERWERRRPLQRDAFNSYEIPKDLIEQEFEEFFNLIKNNKVKNIVEFMEIKGYEKKERRKCEDN